jgi:hypothetical protein
MVIITLRQLIDEKISLLQELMNDKNSSQVNDTYKTQIDTVRSIDDYDIEKVEFVINQRRSF